MRMRRKKRLDERLDACSALLLKVNRDDLNLKTAVEPLLISN